MKTERSDCFSSQVCIIGLLQVCKVIANIYWIEAAADSLSLTLKSAYGIFYIVHILSNNTWQVSLHCGCGACGWVGGCVGGWVGGGAPYATDSSVAALGTR